MNKEMILKVADAIEQHLLANIGFNMGDYISGCLPDMSGHNCETTACIAGYACHIQDGTVPDVAWPAFVRGAEILGLDPEKRLTGDLFFGPFSASATQAAKVLRHFAETGKVDWKI